MARFLCTGDSHLGSGADLGRVPGERLEEQEHVWRQTLSLARSAECDAVLHGGDLFHRASPSPEEVLAALRPLVEHAAQGGCPVVMCIGNHERRGVSEATMPAALSELDVLHVSQSPEVAGDFGGVAVCTLPWISAGRLVADAGGGDRDRLNEHAAELLVEAARSLRANVPTGQSAILLTHFSISGSSLPNGLPVDQLREPVLELADLEALGFDAVVSAHIHKGQVMGRDDVPVFFVGSPMPQNFGEAGYDHGCFILENDPAHGLLTPRFVPLESRPLVTWDVDLGAFPEAELDLGEPGVWARDAIVRLRIVATSEQAKRLDTAALKRALVDAGAHKVASVQVDVEHVDRQRVEGLSEELGEMEALAAWCKAHSINGTREAALRERTERYLERVR